MRTSGLGQFWGSVFKNRWNTSVGRSIQLHFCDLKSRSDEGDWCVITFVNKDY